MAAGLIHPIRPVGFPTYEVSGEDRQIIVSFFLISESHFVRFKSLFYIYVIFKKLITPMQHILFEDVEKVILHSSFYEEYDFENKCEDDSFRK